MSYRKLSDVLNVQLAAVVCLSTGLVACGDEQSPPDDHELVEPETEARLAEYGGEALCGPGDPDWQDVERYNGTLGLSTEFVNNHQGPVGIGSGCTGTLIARDLYLSAGHCAYAVGETVGFNFQVDGADPTRTRPEDPYRITQVLEQFHTSNVDYALVRLAGSPGDQYGYTPFVNRDPAASSHVSLIQHPDGQPKKVHDGPVVDYSSRFGTNYFRHQVDTNYGSSGSGVLDDSGMLVGIHTNVGCNASAPIEGNSAFRMTAAIGLSSRLRQLANGDLALAGDFDSDGKADDIGIFRPSNGQWFAMRSDQTSIFDSLPWGTQGDIPLLGDFDSDKQSDDLGIFRPSTGDWYAMRNTGEVIFEQLHWGTRGDIPLVGDFDSDGQSDDLAVYRPTEGKFYAQRNDGSFVFEKQWGTQGDIPLVGDFDSDGFNDDLGVFRPSNGSWYAMRGDGSVIFDGVQYGTLGDVPFVGDFDGDGRNDDIAVWRQEDGTWFARRVDGTDLVDGLAWGALEDVPLVADFDSDGQLDDLGVWRTSNGSWYTKRTDGVAIFENLAFGAPH